MTHFSKEEGPRLTFAVVGHMKGAGSQSQAVEKRLRFRVMGLGPKIQDLR